MADISSCIEHGLGTNLSSKQFAYFTDETNCNGVGSDVYFKTQLSEDRPCTRDQPMSEFDTETQRMISEDTYKSLVNPSWNILSNGSKVCSQSVNQTNNWINQNIFFIHNSEMDWDPTCCNLVKTSSAAGRLIDRFAYMNLPDQLEGAESRDQTEFNRAAVHDTGELNGSWWIPCYNYCRTENCELTRPSNKSREPNATLECDAGDQSLYEVKPSHAIGLVSGYDEGSLFPSQTYGILPSHPPLFDREGTEIQNNMALSTFANQVGFPIQYCERGGAEGDYLFAEDLVENRKFRLLIDRTTETQMRAEIYPYCLKLSDIIRLKYRSLGIPVEVEACQYQPQDKINVKAFNMMFENSQDVSKAFSMRHNDQLFFLREVRPSPSYHVKYEVLNSVCVFKGQCFSQDWIHILQKGDIVTANQLKGNKIRIIKWCPASGKIDFDLAGWVLLKTRGIDMLRRIDHRREKKVNGKCRSRSAVVSPLLLIQKIVGQHCATRKNQVYHKPNPKRVSAANFSPFKVLVEVEIRKGRRVPTVIGRLKPGRIVWANQHKGSMLRIMKMDKFGNIIVDGNMKPKNWGWVCIHQRGDVKTRLVRIPTSEVMKTGKFMNIRCSHDTLRTKDNLCANNHTKHRSKDSGKARESRIFKFAKENSRSQGKKQLNAVLMNDLEDSISRSSHSDQATSVTNHEENKVGVSSYLRDLAIRAIAGDKRQKPNHVTSRMLKTVAKTTFNREIENIIGEASGQGEPCLLPPMSVTIHSSNSGSPISTSSVSPRPDLYPAINFIS